MAKKGKIDGAIIGSGSVIGKALHEALPGSCVPFGEISLLDEEEFGGVLSEYEGGETIFSEMLANAMENSDIVFLCGSKESSKRCLEMPRVKDRSLFVIDLSGATAADAGILKATATLPHSLKKAPVLALPDSLAVGLATILDACSQAGKVELAASTCLLPVSELGHEGNLALHNQAIELLNFHTIPKDNFGRQLIFNIHPAFGKISKKGQSEFEITVLAQVRELLEAPDLPLSVCASRVPVFYSTVISLFLKYRQPVAEDRLRKVFEENPLFLLDEVTADPATISSPIDAVQSEYYRVGRILGMPDIPSAFQLWINYDNIIRGGVLDAIGLAELLLQDAGLLTAH